MSIPLGMLNPFLSNFMTVRKIKGCLTEISEIYRMSNVKCVRKIDKGGHFKTKLCLKQVWDINVHHTARKFIRSLGKYDIRHNLLDLDYRYLVILPQKSKFLFAKYGTVTEYHMSTRKRNKVISERD